MNEIEIDAPDDPRIEMFRDIRERDLIGRGGLIAEGLVVVEQLLRSADFRATALLVLRARLEGLKRRLGSACAEVPVYVAERPVLDAIAGFPMHRGVLAHGVRRAPTADDRPWTQWAAEGGRVVVVVGVANHDNIGAMFRNAAAFGVSGVLLDDTCCDPLYRKAIRVSVGTALRVPFRRIGTGHQILAELRDAGFSCLALSPRGGVPLARWTPQGPTALFLGAEGTGLPADLMDRMDSIRIEMAPGLDSLNVSTAAALVLHHAYVSGERVAAPGR